MKDGGPAFPGTWTNGSDLNQTAPNGVTVPPFGVMLLPGMSLRAYIATAALQGHIASYSGENVKSPGPTQAATAAVAYADALIAELEKQ